MKLRNKKTGEIVELLARPSFVKKDKENYLASEVICFDSLAKLNEEWEDYEEPKQWYGLNAIRDDGFEPLEYEGFEDLYKHAKELGIAFETKEEAEKAVKKLKAWKRLKDNRFRFETFGYDRQTVKNGRVNIMIRATFDEKYGDGSVKLSDLDLLFGGEE